MRRQLNAPVMLLFFNRPDSLQKVFDAIKQCRPRQLFLVQDGARDEKPDDMEKIIKCREIVEKIDWDCDVYRNYSATNLTCDHREFTGISWCFEYVDSLIILEDDCVPTQSFLYLCEELLERYKNDTRIHSISGFNRVGIYENSTDYIFSKTGAGWGWATWKRVWEKAEKLKELKFLDDSQIVDMLTKKMEPSIKALYGDVITQGEKIRVQYQKTGVIPSWEYLIGMVLVLNDMLTITPSRNMIKYIGISENATHTSADPRLLPHKIRKVLMQEAYEIENEFRHPSCVERDMYFEKLDRKAMYYPWKLAKIESTLLRIRYNKIGMSQHIWRKMKDKCFKR